MINRKKEIVKLVLVLIVLGVLVVFAAKTAWVGINLALYSNEVIESSVYANESTHIREEANAIYEMVNAGRENFYNSADPYIRFISNMDNIIRVPFALFVMFSPLIFLSCVRKYNLKKAKQIRSRG